MTDDLDPAIGLQLCEACDQFPYHELVAYACGQTIKDLTDLLERGAVAGDDLPNLRDFTREYCRKDAEYARTAFATIWSNSQAGMRGNMQQLWAWFDKRWPCQNPLAITTLLASERVEELALDASFAPGEVSRAVEESLRRAGWFHGSELSEPSADLARLLEATGHRRESDARPGPRPTPESS